MLNEVFLTLFHFFVSTTASPISVSNNTASHDTQTLPNNGDSKLVCRSAKWPDVLFFFLLNYVAHAATLKTLPGESAFVQTLNILAAFFFPASGVFRGFYTIFSCARFAKTDLEMAARAGALCTVTTWPPEKKGTISSPKLTEGMQANDRGKAPPEPWSLVQTSIHGRYKLPENCILSVIPQNSKFKNDPPKGRSGEKDTCISCSINHEETKISCSYNPVKILVALIQLLYACITMYQSRGYQIDWYGFSAFGLTVAPYAWMSLVNLFANLMCPEYPSMYLVRSETMEKEFETANQGNQGGQVNQANQTDPVREYFFCGAVGRLEDEESAQREPSGLWATTKKILSSMFDEHTPNKPWKFRVAMTRFFGLIILTGLGASVPIAIIGSISRFQLGLRSSAAQQVFVGLWMLHGVYFGVISSLLQRALGGRRPDLNIWVSNQRSKVAQLLLVLTLLLSFNAILGLVHVGEMIKAYGVCVLID